MADPVKTDLVLLPTGDANFWRLMDGDRWIAVVQFNGELMLARQVEFARQFCAAPALLASLENMLVCYRDEENKTNVDRRAFTSARAAVAKAKNGISHG